MLISLREYIDIKKERIAKIKPGSFIRIIDKGESKEDLQIGIIYKVENIEECPLVAEKEGDVIYLNNLIEKCQKLCKSNFKVIEVCLDNKQLCYSPVKQLRHYSVCHCEIEIYEGPIENTNCYKCKDYLFCTIIGGNKIQRR